MTFGQWLCLSLPWHRLSHSFWASERCQVAFCRRCKREWVLNHDVRAVLPWDDAMKKFHRDLDALVGR